jgi:hypothetical protein
MSAGKGDRPRHKNNAQWDLNYERVFGKDKKVADLERKEEPSLVRVSIKPPAKEGER